MIVIKFIYSETYFSILPFRHRLENSWTPSLWWCMHILILQKYRKKEGGEKGTRYKNSMLVRRIREPFHGSNSIPDSIASAFF